VLARVPQYYDYWHGRGFLFPLLATVPRFIFPNKYDVAMGHREFVEQFYGYDEWGMGKNATGCSLMAEAFLNFGIPGVVGVFLPGVGQRTTRNLGALIKHHIFFPLCIFTTFVMPHRICGIWRALEFHADAVRNICYRVGALELDSSFPEKLRLSRFRAGLTRCLLRNLRGN
jgi:hypothetical protein